MSDAQQRIETAIARLEQLKDQRARETAREAIAAVLELHREGLVRLLERMPNVQRAAVATEPLVSSLLVLHDLHPADLEARVRGAIEKVRPLLALNGASAELAFVEGDVRVTLSRGAGCGSTGSKLKTTVEQGLLEAAPDARSITVQERESA